MQDGAKAPSVAASKRSGASGLSIIGQQKDVKENAYSERNANIKYASVEPITLSRAKNSEDSQSRFETIFKQLNLVTDAKRAAAKKAGLARLEDKTASIKDADVNSQVSAITFMYTSSTHTSRKKPKDGIQ